MLKKLIWLNRDDLLMYAGINLGVFLLMQVIHVFVMLVLFPCDAILVSGILMMVFSAVTLCFGAVGHVNLTYMQALEFGQTRRRALWRTLALIVFETLFTLAVVAVLVWVEYNLSPRFWMALAGADGYTLRVNGYAVVCGGSLDGVELNIDGFAQLDWWVYPLILGLASLIGIIAGALIQRFGSKGGWTLWGVWMFFCCGGIRLLPWKQHTILDWLVPLAAAVLAAGLVWSLWSLRRATVKN